MDRVHQFIPMYKRYQPKSRYITTLYRNIVVPLLPKQTKSMCMYEIKMLNRALKPTLTDSYVF